MTYKLLLDLSMFKSIICDIILFPFLACLAIIIKLIQNCLNIFFDKNYMNIINLMYDSLRTIPCVFLNKIKCVILFIKI